MHHLENLSSEVLIQVVLQKGFGDRVSTDEEMKADITQK